VITGARPGRACTPLGLISFNVRQWTNVDPDDEGPTSAVQPHVVEYQLLVAIKQVKKY
jgi:hypothetical protein